MINNLTTRLNEKDKQIETLQSQLNDSKREIEDLQTELKSAKQNQSPSTNGTVSFTGNPNEQLSALDTAVKDEIQARKELEQFTYKLHSEQEAIARRLKRVEEDKNVPEWSKEKRNLRNVGVDLTK
jgi:chromosome segregation ATPase